MGVSTDAVLFYGLCLGDELGERIDVESRAGKEGEPIEGSLAWLNYMGRTDLGCVVGTHCSGECPMYYIAASGSIIKASRGYPKRIGMLHIMSKWGLNVRAFCKKYSVTPDGIEWWLVSYWG